MRICQLTRTQFPFSMVDCSDGHNHRARESTVDFRRQENVVPKLNHKQGPRALPHYGSKHMTELFRTGEQLLQAVLFRQPLPAPAKSASTSSTSRKRPAPQRTAGSPAAKRARVDPVASESGVHLTTQRYIPRKSTVLQPHEVTGEWSRAWIELCIRTWQQINQTAAFCDRPHNRYRFETHCLIVWSWATKTCGFKCRAFSIPSDPLLLKGMPKEAEMQTLVGTLASTVKNKNVFDNCVKELNKGCRPLLSSGQTAGACAPLRRLND
jgi:hypothetical protein